MNYGKYFESIKLASAAYADGLHEAYIDNTKAYIDVLGGVLRNDNDDLPALPETEAARFASEYSVVDQYESELGTGLDAVLFESASGEMTLAIRGSEIPLDLGDDSANLFDILPDGMAISQATDLFNYYQRLVTPVGDHALQLVLHENELRDSNSIAEIPAIISVDPDLGFGGQLYNYFTIKPDSDETQGLGKIPAGATIDVTGHSLGGHLAMVMSRFDPEGIGQATNFNGIYFDHDNVGLNLTEWFFNCATAEMGSVLTTRHLFDC